MNTPPRAIAAHAVPQSDRTCLLLWRVLSLAVAAILAVTMHNLEASGLFALFGEHLGEVVEYVGEWFGRL